MATHSLNFNTYDLSVHGLTVMNHTMDDFLQEVDFRQLIDVAYPFGATRVAKPISFDIAIIGIDTTDTRLKVDLIKGILNQRDTKHLILGSRPDRFIRVQFRSLSGRYASPCVFMGDLDFICPDPVAYDITEKASVFAINADPGIVTETTGGTGSIRPVYTLTAGETLTNAMIQIECIEAVEALRWVGSLALNDVLEIDTVNWVVKKQGVESMIGVSGRFPRLLPAITNRIRVTGFGVLGTMVITYRNTFV